MRYFPPEILPDNDPDKVLDRLNYPAIPTPSEFRSARRHRVASDRVAPGGKLQVQAAEQAVYTDFVEFANDSDEPLEHPMLVNAGYAGFYMMYIDGVKLITHLGAPLVVTISYVLFEADRTMTFKQSLVGFAPTLLYAAVAYPCNIMRLWDGPYPFLQVWNMPVWQSILWFIVLFILAISLCQIPRLLARRYGRKAAEAKKGLHR